MSSSESVGSKPICSMKRGDYNIHILISEVKNLIGKDNDTIPCPNIKVSVGEFSQRTKAISVNVSNYFFGENFYFDLFDLSVDNLEKQKILIEVIDSNNLDRKEYLGISEFDLEYIYKSENHSFSNRWIALANVESNDFSKIRGFLRLSISVLHENDDRVKLSSIIGTEEKILVPSQIKVKYKQITIYVFKAVGLPDMDSMFFKDKRNKDCDGFIKASYMGSNITTGHIKMKSNTLIWNQKLLISLVEPCVSNKIFFSVLDYDISSDDLIGVFDVHIEDIRAGKYSKPVYINMYGGNTEGKEELVELMNNNPKAGSAWKGKILLSMQIADTEVPRFEVEHMNLEERNMVDNFSEKELWEFNINLDDVSFLPSDDNYMVVFEYENLKVTFLPHKSVNRTIKYENTRKLQFFSSNSSADNLTDLFVYIVRGEKDESKNRICFQRLEGSLFLDNKQTMVIKLVPDMSLATIEDLSYSGIVRATICLTQLSSKHSATQPPISPEKPKHVDELPHEEKGESEESSLDMDQIIEQKKAKLIDEKKKEEARINELRKLSLDPTNLKIDSKATRLSTVIVNVFMTRYLINGDDTGTSDLYVKVTLCNNVQKTTIKWNLVNAVFNESLKFKDVELDPSDKSTWPIAFVEVMDKDPLVDDKLGYSYIWIFDSAYQINSISTLIPKWEQLHLPKSNIPKGQVLLSFFVIDQSRTDILKSISSIQINPSCNEYTFEINAVGLRELEPLGIIPVKKAYVSFDLSSLRMPLHESKASSSDYSKCGVGVIKTDPTEAGSNPTMNALINFKLFLPINEIYIPDLQSVVSDLMLGGLINENLGIFILNIKESRSRSEAKLYEDIELCQEILKNIANSSKEAAILNSDKLESLNHEKAIKEKSASFVKFAKYKEYALPTSQKQGLKPQIYIVEDEDQCPSIKEYMAIGYIKAVKKDLLTEENLQDLANINDISAVTKHYRRIFQRPLEDDQTGLNIKSPFHKIPIRRSKYVDQTSVTEILSLSTKKESKILRSYTKNSITDEVKKENEFDLANFDNSKSFGYFKGLVKIYKSDLYADFKKQVQSIRDIYTDKLPPELHFLNCYDELERQLLVKKEVLIRVYILDFTQLKNRDLVGKSDPYLKIILGSTVIDESKEHIEDSETLDVYKCYDLTATMPGASLLKIQAWDYDSLFKDDLIGETKIDIEDRFYDENWSELEHKPIEVRPLFHPDEHGSQGYVSMWLEIIDKKERPNIKKWSITPSPKNEVELRLVIWQTEDIPMMDAEGTSDIYITSFVDPEKQKSTDVHFRCQSGCASFNWRCLHYLTLPIGEQSAILNINAFDKDIFSKDDFICFGSIDLTKMLKEIYQLDMPISYSKIYHDSLTQKDKDLMFFNPESSKDLEINFEKNDDLKFWLPLKRINSQGQAIRTGSVEVSLEILPKWKADICKVGDKRDEPNVNPYLPPPTGRFEFSLNPFKMLNQCVGPRYRRRFYMLICIIMYCLWFIFVLPYVVWHLAGAVSNPFNWAEVESSTATTTTASTTTS